MAALASGEAPECVLLVTAIKPVELARRITKAHSAVVGTGLTRVTTRMLQRAACCRPRRTDRLGWYGVGDLRVQGESRLVDQLVLDVLVHDGGFTRFHRCPSSSARPMGSARNRSTRGLFRQAWRTVSRTSAAAVAASGTAFVLGAGGWAQDQQALDRQLSLADEFEDVLGRVGRYSEGHGQLATLASVVLGDPGARDLSYGSLDDHICPRWLTAMSIAGHHAQRTADRKRGGLAQAAVSKTALRPVGRRLGTVSMSVWSWSQVAGARGRRLR